MKLKVFILFLLFLFCSCSSSDDRDSGFHFDNSDGKEYSFDNRVNSEASFYGGGNSIGFSTVRVLSKFKSFSNIPFTNSAFKTRIKCKETVFSVFLSSRFVAGFYLYFLCVMRN
ncbi:MAG: hypothetical protein II956_01110 [Bacteroidales bacterium]|nr:hypothetical protein [Bacteroidales bacterium]